MIVMEAFSRLIERPIEGDFLSACRVVGRGGCLICFL